MRFSVNQGRGLVVLSAIDRPQLHQLTEAYLTRTNVKHREGALKGSEYASEVVSHSSIVGHSSKQFRCAGDGGGVGLGGLTSESESAAARPQCRTTTTTLEILLPWVARGPISARTSVYSQFCCLQLKLWRESFPPDSA